MPTMIHSDTIIPRSGDDVGALSEVAWIPKKPVLIWTRSLSDWTNDQTLFSALPERVLHMPAITLTPIASPDWPVNDPQNLVVTSVNAIRIMAGSPRGLAVLTHAKRVFTFGEHCYSALAKLGVQAVRPDSALTGSELAAFMSQSLPAESEVCFLGAANPAFDWVTSLNRAGFATLKVDLYKSMPEVTSPDGQVLTPAQIERLRNSLSGVVCFARPSAVEGFCRVLNPRACRLGTSLAVVAIGSSTLKSALPFFRYPTQATSQSIASLAENATELFRRVFNH